MTSALILFFSSNSAALKAAATPLEKAVIVISVPALFILAEPIGTLYLISGTSNTSLYNN